MNYEKQKEYLPELVEVFKSLQTEYGSLFNLRIFDKILKDHVNKTPKNSVSDVSVEAIKETSMANPKY